MAPTIHQTGSKTNKKQVKSNQVKTKRKCRDCNKIYENNFVYASHSLKVHYKQVKCPMQECDQKLKSFAGLMNHLRTTHKNACSLCGRSNKNKSGLLVHLALVHDIKRCVCSVPRCERINAHFE